MRISVVALVVLFLPLASPAWGQDLLPEEIDELNEECLDCHEDMDPDEVEFVFDSGKVIYFEFDASAVRQSLHGEILACESCHGEEYVDDHPDFDYDMTAREYAVSRSELCQSCHEEIEQRHSSEAEDAPNCVDCHSAHGDLSFEDEPLTILNRCDSCHETEFEDFQEGGHSEATAEIERNSDLPECNTCHPAHGDVEGTGMPLIARVTTLCIDCHSDDSLLVLKYEREGAVVTSYMDDFHGLTFQHLLKGLEGTDPSEIMTCATCHGPHNVGPLTEEEVAAVCAECHEGVDTRFAGAWLGHGEIGPERGVLVWIIRIAYQFLIPMMMVGLLVHIIIQLTHHYRTRKVEVSDEDAIFAGLPASVQRFTKLERAEHSAVAFLFILLVLTGIPQGYPSSGVAGAVIEFWGGIFSARFIHRVCGFAFVAIMVAHVLHGVYVTVRSHKLPEILPTAKDFKDIFESLRHQLGLGPAPRFGKFDYGEKFEYWGLFLGGVLIGGTGILLVFPEATSTYLPGVALAAARVAHGYEATLAVLVVLVWHLWGVTFRPEVFPFDKSMLTGMISTERLREEHGLEYDKLVAEHESGSAAETKEGTV